MYLILLGRTTIMAYIPLVEHTHPRVLMIDFPQLDVEKLIKVGFDAKRGASGLLKNDRNRFCLPYAIQDVEIVFSEIHASSFSPEYWDTDDDDWKPYEPQE